MLSSNYKSSNRNVTGALAALAKIGSAGFQKRAGIFIYTRHIFVAAKGNFTGKSVFFVAL